MQGFVGVEAYGDGLGCPVSQEEAGGCGMDWDVLQVWGVVERGFLSKGGFSEQGRTLGMGWGVLRASQAAACP